MGGGQDSARAPRAVVPEAVAVEVELPHVFLLKFDLSHSLGFSRIPLTALPPAGERAWSSGISCCQGHYSQTRGGGGHSLRSHRGRRETASPCTVVSLEPVWHPASL